MVTRAVNVALSFYRTAWNADAV